jgi:hypothetical protein
MQQNILMLFDVEFASLQPESFPFLEMVLYGGEIVESSFMQMNSWSVMGY